MQAIRANSPATTQVGLAENATVFVPVMETDEHIDAARRATREGNAPFLTALYALPKIALAPLFVLLLGIGIASKIVLVAVTVFFLLLYATLDGVRDIDRDLVLTGITLRR